MARHRALGHIETDAAAARTTLLGGDQRQIDGIGNEIRRQEEALRLGLGREIIRLAGEAVLEIVRGVEDEIESSYRFITDGPLVTAT